MLTLIICGGAILLGNLHWNKKITAHSESVTNAEGKQKEQEKETATPDLSSYAAHLPESVQNKIKTAQTSGQPLQFVIYGSDAAAEEEGTWSTQLKSQLENTYGKKIFQVTILSEGDQTTRDVVKAKSYEKVNELKPDIVLFEPFMLKDNSGLIGMDNTLANIETMMESWKSVNEAVSIMIQPPNPLYSAIYYPKQVDQLQEHAEAYKIIYLDHWEVWPDIEDVKMQSYLTEDNKPNDSGNKLWADFLINYFIAK